MNRVLWCILSFDMKAIEALSKIEIFAGLGIDVIKELADFCVVKRYQRSEVIFEEGTKAIGFFVVLSGMVKIFKTSWEGKEQVLHIFGPYEIFAEVPVFYGSDYPASAEALEYTELLFVPSKPFIDFLKRNAEVAIKLLGLLSKRLRYFVQLAEDLSLKEVPSRLSSYILYRHSQTNGSYRITLDIPKNLLAGLLGTTPESISRAFYRLKQKGCIEVLGRDILILDKRCLEKIAIEGRYDGS